MNNFWDNESKYLLLFVIPTLLAKFQRDTKLDNIITDIMERY
jgi:hypothetical protein